MFEAAYYPAFFGTFLSIVLLTHLAWKEHNPGMPQTLSRLAAQNKELVRYFRAVLWVCGTLFAVTMFFFIVPQVRYSGLQLAAWIIYYGCELLLAVFPERGTIEKQLHGIFAYTMGVAMLATTVLFVANLHGTYQYIETAILGAMGVFGILTLLHKKRVIFYELSFIYLSHLSILVAATALK